MGWVPPKQVRCDTGASCSIHHYQREGDVHARTDDVGNEQRENPPTVQRGESQASGKKVEIRRRSAPS